MKVMSKDTWVLALIMFVGSSACRKESPCGRLYERLVACGRRPGITRAQFLGLCREQRKTGVDRTHCARRGDCKAFVACLRQEDEEADLAHLLARLDGARRQHRPGALLVECRRRLAEAKGQLLRELKAKCVALAEDAYERTEAALKKKRGKPGSGNSSRACRRLTEAAELLGRQREAMVLCEELRYGNEVASVLAQVREVESQVVPTLPLHCHVVLEMLSRARHETAWLKEQRRRVAAACYHDLGGRILSWALARRQPRCPPVLATLIEELERYAVPVPAGLVAPLRKAYRRCRPERPELPASLFRSGPRDARRARP